MTPEERQLLNALCDRIRSAPAQTRDAEADGLIGQLSRERPETAYLLAQTVLMQDFALRNAQAQISQLQQQLADAQRGATEQPRSGGSFLGGLFGGGQPAAPQQVPIGSVPTGSVPTGSVPGVNPWGRPAASPQPAYYPPQQQAYQPVVMQPTQTSSFLRDAATTAAGVAGGALLFEGIESLFGAHRGFGGGMMGGGMMGGGWGGGGMPMESLTETTIINNNNTYIEEPGAGRDYAADQTVPDNSGFQDTSLDDFSSDDSGGGSDSGGSDWA